MARTAARHVEESTRDALLDAAEAVMVGDGYAAATTRRIAATANANSGLVTYYFGTLDNLFVELFRRRAERSLDRLQHTLDDPQPLWALWEQAYDRSSNAIVMEFIALANHRRALKKEIAAYSREHRRLELDRLSTVLEGYGVDLERWPATSLLVLMTGTARFLLIEESFNVDIGHVDVVAVIEREIAALEGKRQKREHHSPATT